MSEIDWYDLRKAAHNATARSYAPYSHFRVGAAALVDDGRVITGCNVENASYGLSLCAECGVVSSLHDSGGGRLIAVTAVHADGTILAPCGRCRQLLLEAGGHDLLVDGTSDPGPVRAAARLLLCPRPRLSRHDHLMDAIDVIRTKRDGHTLSKEQIDWFIDAYTGDLLAPEQASALLMAIVWRGMQPGELNLWTDAMLSSGETLDLSSLGRPTADKHSTGGVGDKVSLILAPLVAACGVSVPMLSGRGLGHTGGTLDKLEAIRDGGRTWNVTRWCASWPTWDA